HLLLPKLFDALSERRHRPRSVLGDVADRQLLQSLRRLPRSRIQLLNTGDRLGDSGLQHLFPLLPLLGALLSVRLEVGIKTFQPVLDSGRGTARFHDRRDAVERFLLLLSIDSLRRRDRKSTRLNSSHVKISYAVFCLKKKK